MTTGLLVGIGESRLDRVEALLRIRDLHQRYGHIQARVCGGGAGQHSAPRAHEPALTTGPNHHTHSPPPPPPHTHHTHPWPCHRR